MIRIKYECDETGQKMIATITIPENKEKKSEVAINFFPPAKDTTQDPHGIINHILKSFKP